MFAIMTSPDTNVVGLKNFIDRLILEDEEDADIASGKPRRPLSFTAANE